MIFESANILFLNSLCVSSCYKVFIRLLKLPSHIIILDKEASLIYVRNITLTDCGVQMATAVHQVSNTLYLGFGGQC